MIGLIITLATTPAVAAILGCVLTHFKNKSVCKEVIDRFDDLRKEVASTKEYEDMKAQLALVHQENRELKRKLNELLTKIDHIQRGE